MTGGRTNIAIMSAGTVCFPPRLSCASSILVASSDRPPIFGLDDRLGNDFVAYWSDIVLAEMTNMAVMTDSDLRAAVKKDIRSGPKDRPKALLLEEFGVGQESHNIRRHFMKKIHTTPIAVLIFFMIISGNSGFCQNPWNMSLLGRAMYDGSLNSFYPYKDYLYTATTLHNPARGVITTIGVSDFEHPVRISSFYEGLIIGDLLILDSILCASTQTGGVVLFDLSSPSSPVEIVEHNINYGFGVMQEYNGNIASRSWDVFKILDISDLHNPIELCEINMPYPNYVLSFDFHDNYLLINEGSMYPVVINILRIYDLTDISNPVNIYYDTLYSPINSLFDLVVVGNYVYLYSGGYGFEIYDITDPQNPDYAGAFFEDVIFDETMLIENHLYASTSDGSIRIIDVSEPSNPVIANDYHSHAPVSMFRPREDFIYTASITGDISFLDIKVPDFPIYIGAYIPGINSWGIAKNGDYVYLADNRGGFKVTDVTDPESPVGVNHFYTDQQTRNVFISDSLLFVAANYNGVMIYSISDPLHPDSLSTVFMSAGAMDMFAADSLLYVACHSSGFFIVNISDPASPSILGHYNQADPNNFILSVIAYRDFAYTAERYEGVCVYDVSDPSNPERISCYDEANYPHDFFIVDSTLYVADWGNGLLILDISEPSDPSFVGLGECDQSFGVWIDREAAFIADREFGIKVFDVSDPYTPELVGSYDDDPYCNEIYAEKDTVYAAVCDGGLWILKFDNPAFFVCGDADADGTINILDVSYIISYLYKNGPAPEPEEAADADGGGNLSLLDVTYLINYLYKNGPEPVCS
jgi:hypothetical protein